MSDEKVDAWMPLWIGEYLADTMALSRDSHGGYLLLLFAYWRNKGPLVDDDEDLAGITKAGPAEWKKLRLRLSKFFTIEGGLWIHGRADKELVKAGQYKAAAVSKAKAAAEARWKKHREQCSTDAPSIAQAVPEQCPPPSPTPNREPSSPSVKKERVRAATPQRPADVAESVWDDWLALRRKKSAPVTATVVDSAMKEAASAGMTLEAFLRVWCFRGSQGLQAEWLKPHERGANGTPINRQEAIEQRNRDVGDRWLAEQEALDATH